MQPARIRRFPRPVDLAPLLGAVSLRTYELLALEHGPVQQLLNLPNFGLLVPYAVALALSRYPRLQAPAAGFAWACLAADLYAHVALYGGPGTDSLFVIFMPLWNLLVIGPAGACLAWLVARQRSSRAA